MVFLMPPSFQELEKRLVQRQTEFAIDLERRLAAATEEMKNLHLFEYAVVNPSEAIDTAVTRIQAIITAEKCRTRQRQVKI